MSAWTDVSGPQGPVGATGPQGATGSQGATGPAGQDGAPTGSIFFFAGAAAPTGYLLCNGATVSRTTYAALFAIIGTAFGAGDGSTTFALPDLRSRVPVGAGQGTSLTNRVLAAVGGEENHALTIAELAAHTHTYTQPAAPTNSFYTLSAPGVQSVNAGQATGSAGSGTAHNTMQPFVVLTPIIKT